MFFKPHLFLFSFHIEASLPELLFCDPSPCLPDKECPGGGCGSDDPCQLFQNISFPVEEFFPPNALESPCDYEGTKHYCSCRK